MIPILSVPQQRTAYENSHGVGKRDLPDSPDGKWWPSVLQLATEPLESHRKGAVSNLPQMQRRHMVIAGH